MTKPHWIPAHDTSQLRLGSMRNPARGFMHGSPPAVFAFGALFLWAHSTPNGATTFPCVAPHSDA
jgi:hypothetical protein